MEKRIWIAKREYDSHNLVSVLHCPIDGLFNVEQYGKLCVICSHLCLRNVYFLPKEGLVRGHVATFRELSNLHDRDKHDGNKCYPSKVVDFSISKGFIDESGHSITWAEYLDMVATDTPHLIAIYPSRIFEPEIPF